MEMANRTDIRYVEAASNYGNMFYSTHLDSAPTIFVIPKQVIPEMG
jgi:hypothetical protein